jgi:hypothetical protein
MTGIHRHLNLSQINPEEPGSGIEKGNILAWQEYLQTGQWK